MSATFEYDVFLSHSSKDKPEVRELAERLKADGLRVWFDEWEIKPGDPILLAIEKGLESSHTLVLVMSVNSIGDEAAEWVTLERHTALFRDPTNQQRRFIPLRLDDHEINDCLKPFAYIDWRQKNGADYARLLSACTPAPVPTELTQSPFLNENTTQLSSFHGAIRCGERLMTIASAGEYLSLWDCREQSPQVTLGRAFGTVKDATVTADGRFAVVATGAASLTIWDLGTRKQIKDIHTIRDGIEEIRIAETYLRIVCRTTSRVAYVLDVGSSIPRELRRNVRCIAINNDGSTVGCGDMSNRIIAIDVGTNATTVLGIHAAVSALVFSADGERLISAGADGALRVWNLADERCESVLEGHTDPVQFLTIANKCSRRLVSGSSEGEFCVWDLLSGALTEKLVVLHSTPITDMACSCTGLALLTVSDYRIHISDLPPFDSTAEAPITKYTNAKVLLVGDSGVGKTALAIRLTEGRFESTISTDAHWASQLKLQQVDDVDGVDREIWLWDFAGQADYRLIHQLFMDETSLAVLVFNQQSDNPFDGLGQWDRDLALTGQGQRAFSKLLVAGRSDRGGLTVSRESIDRFAKDCGYAEFLQTSALTGYGCDVLREAILRYIDWESIPWTTSPSIFKRLKDEIVAIGDSGAAVIRMSELKQQLEMRLTDYTFTYRQLQAVVGLLAGPGHVWQLEFGEFVVLHPEVINSYAAAVGRTVRSHLQQLGVIHESAMLAGQLNFGDIRRLPPSEEAIILRAMHQTLVDHGFCLQQETDEGRVLVFPSYFSRERREQIEHPSIIGTFQFKGALEELYATLVVKLQHTRAFDTEELWRYAADFRAVSEGGKMGLKMTKLGEGEAQIVAYGEYGSAVQSESVAANTLVKRTAEAENAELEARKSRVAAAFAWTKGSRARTARLRQVKEDAAKATTALAKVAQVKATQTRDLRRKVVEANVAFMQYIHEHLKQYDPDVSLVRHYMCRNPECLEAVSDVKAIRRARENGLTQLPCQYCFEPIPLWDELERELASEKHESRVREMEAISRARIDRESRDLMLEYHAFAVAEETSQTFVPIGNDDLGAQARIELLDLSGRRSDHSVYLQLGASDIYESVSTNSDGSVIFECDVERVRAIESSETAVMLVHRTSDGYIRWMDIGAWLRKRRRENNEPTEKIVFDGEPFTALNLQKIRKRVFE